MSTNNNEDLPPYHERQSQWNQLCLVHALNMLLGEKWVDKNALDQVCETLSSNNPELMNHSSSSSSSSSSMVSSLLFWNNTNPHRSMFGLGNYDVNVAMYVLNETGYEASFWDARKSVDSMPLDNNDTTRNLVGFLVNVQKTNSSILTTVAHQHWLPKSWFRHWIIYRRHSVRGKSPVNHPEDKRTSKNNPNPNNATPTVDAVISNTKWYRLDSLEMGPVEIPNMKSELSNHLSLGDHILLVRN